MGGTLCFAQSASPKTPNKTATTAVAPDELVIQIADACQTPPGEFAVRDCIRGVTREEFEALVAATNPNAGPAEREKLAENIGRLILLSNEARKRGIPKDPKVHELLRMLQAQELAKLLLSQSEKQAGTDISDSDIEKFYQAHLDDYQSAELIRLVIPRKNPDADSPEDMTYAESIRSRCSAGEDPDKLQAESLQRVGRDNKRPEDLKAQKRAQYKEPEQVIFGMKAGECTVVAEGKSDLIVYKMVAEATQPLAEVHDAIVQAIKQERFRGDISGISKEHPIRLNQKYFSSSTANSK